MYCPDCQTNLDDVPVGDRCPSCGSDRRSATASPQTATAKVEVLRPTLEITSNPERPWFEKWWTVLDLLERLTIAYRTTEGTGNVEAEQIVKNLFNELNDMRDWLKKDDVNLPGLSDTAVDAHATTYQTVANAMANTYKHHTRCGKQIEAQVRTARVGPAGVTVTIEYDIKSIKRKPQMLDAMTQAQQAVDSWRQFFVEEGIGEPIR
jgi:hypothetical protein